MNDQSRISEQTEAFVEKLNAFMQSLDPQEQGWLVGMLGPASAGEDVQGYVLLPYFSIDLSAKPSSVAPPVPAPGGGQPAVPQFTPFSMTSLSGGQISICFPQLH